MIFTPLQGHYSDPLELSSWQGRNGVCWEVVVSKTIGGCFTPMCGGFYMLHFDDECGHIFSNGLVSEKNTWFFSFESSSHPQRDQCCVQDQWFTRVKSDEGGKSSYKEECIYEGSEHNLGDGNKGHLFCVSWRPCLRHFTHLRSWILCCFHDWWIRYDEIYKYKNHIFSWTVDMIKYPPTQKKQPVHWRS